MLGLAPLMNVLFCGQHDRDLPGNVLNRLLGSSMVDMGIIKQYEVSFLQMLIDILGHGLTRDLVTELNLITDFDLIITKFHRIFATGAASQQGWLIGHLTLFHLVTWMCSYVETSLSPELVMFPEFVFEHPYVALMTRLISLSHWTVSEVTAV